MIGPPIGVDPRNATDHSDITRPRKCGRLASCSVLALVERNAVLAAPIASSATSAGPSEGASATPVIVRLNTRESSVSDRRPTFIRRATTRPPITAPTPIAEVMNP